MLQLMVLLGMVVEELRSEQHKHGTSNRIPLRLFDKLSPHNIGGSASPTGTVTGSNMHLITLGGNCQSTEVLVEVIVGSSEILLNDMALDTVW